MADYEGFSHIEICSMVSATVGNLIKVGVGGVLFVKDWLFESAHLQKTAILQHSLLFIQSLLMSG